MTFEVSYDMNGEVVASIRGDSHFTVWLQNLKSFLGHVLMSPWTSFFSFYMATLKAGFHIGRSI